MSDKVDAYIVLEGAFVGELVRNVNHYIAQGWVPLGGLVYRQPVASTGIAFYQALIKYSKYVEG